MKTLALVILLCFAQFASAESFFHAEVGLGQQISKDMGDGIWKQDALPHSEKMVTPVYFAGIYGSLFEEARWDMQWHLDYFYFGTLTASCLCVPDANYNPQTHQTVGTLPRLSPFNGQGHTQGVSLTIAPGYSMDGLRFGVEAGPMLYWATWHESLYDLANHWDNLSHKTHMQLGWVAGASVSHGSWTLSYRYYYERAQWNPQPGIVTGTHMLMLEKHF